MTPEEIHERALMARDMLDHFFWKRKILPLHRIVEEMNEGAPAGADTHFGLEVAVTVVEKGQARTIPIGTFLPAYGGPEGEISTGFRHFQLPGEEAKAKG